MRRPADEFTAYSRTLLWTIVSAILVLPTIGAALWALAGVLLLFQMVLSGSWTPGGVEVLAYSVAAACWVLGAWCVYRRLLLWAGAAYREAAAGVAARVSRGVRGGTSA